MMTRNIRKIVSIICAVAILLSISSVSFTGSSSALVDIPDDLMTPQMSEEVNLTFEGAKPYGIPLGRYTKDVAYQNGYAKVKTSNNWIFFGKNGSVGQTTVKHNDTDTEKVSTALSNVYKLTKDNTYSITFKYKFLAGATVTSRTFDVGIATNPTTGSAKNDNTVWTNNSTSGLGVVWKVNGETQTGTLTQDTDWQTVTVNFKAVVDGYFGMQCGGSASSNQYFAIDDFVVKKLVGSYGITKITHDMESDKVNTATGATANGTIVADSNAGTSIVASGDAEHGKVLNLASDASRFTLTDSGVFVEGKKYYISFDAKSTNGTSGFGWISLGKDKTDKNKIHEGSRQDPRVGIHSTAAVQNVLEWYVNGVEVQYSEFVVTANQWNHYDIVIDLADAAVVQAFETAKSTIFDAARWFYIGRANSQFDNFEILALDPNATPGHAFVEEVIDGKSKYSAVAVGSKYTLTTPVDATGDRSFKCWIDANGNEIADPSNYVPAKGFNKVIATWNVFVGVTHDMESDAIATNDSGSIGNKFIANGAKVDLPGASIIDSGDAKHGKVLEMTANRGTFGDIGVITPGMKYCISFDGRTTDASSKYMWLAIAGLTDNGKNTDGSQNAPRYFLSNNEGGTSRDFASISNAVKFYIDGVETTQKNFKISGEWQNFSIVLDLTDENVVKAINDNGSKKDKKGQITNVLLREDMPRYFYFGIENSQYDNFKIYGVNPDATTGKGILEEVVNGATEFKPITVGSKYPLPILTDPTGNRVFKYWVDAEGKEIKDQSNYVPSKGYNKIEAVWTVTFVQSTHDMEKDTFVTNETGILKDTLIANDGKGASIIDSGDAKYGKVLAFNNEGTRFTAVDSNIFTKGMKYFISFDAKSTSGASQAMWISFGKQNSGSNLNGSKGNPRYIFSATSPFEFYIDGKKTAYADFKLGTEWQNFNIVIDLTDEEVVSVLEAVEDFFKYEQLFYVGVKDSWFDNLKIYGADPDAASGNAIVQVVVDDESEITTMAVGSKVTLPKPVDPTGDREFKCWVDQDGNEIKNPNNYTVSKAYTKLTATWTIVFVRVTYVDLSVTKGPIRVRVGTKLPLPDGNAEKLSYFKHWVDADNKIYTEVPDKDVVLYAKYSGSVVTLIDGSTTYGPYLYDAGTKLSAPEKRPDSSLFFQGWIDADGKVFTVVPNSDVVLYSKYNGTILTFNNIFTVDGQDGTSGNGSLVKDPDNAKNSVIKIISNKNTKMFTLPVGDFEGAKRFELKTNTTYTYSIRYKIGADAKDGTFQLVRGNGIYKENSFERTDIPGVPGVKVLESEKATEWMTVSGTFTTGDSHYLERVYWYYQNNLILKATGEFEVYFDDIVIAEVLTEAPKGAYTIDFKTNGPVLNPVYGYTGETIKLPTDIVNGTSVFAGWYTDKKLTVPFTATKFGTENVTLYAKWNMEPFVMDLENYDNSGPASRCHLEKDDKGNHYFDWNSDFKPEQSATTVYSQQVNANGKYCTLLPGVEYKVTFKYKLLKGSFNIGVVYNNAGGSWSDRKEGVKPITLNDVDENNWKTASFTFTADCDKNNNYLNFGVAGTGNCYFDDIIVECSTNLFNLYGSTVIMLNANGGETVEPVAGDPGELIGKLPTTTRSGYQFDGWYTDSECKTKFTDKTFGEEGTVLYAGWIIGKFKESFEEFPKTITLAGGYKLYNAANFKTGFDKSNVQSGDTSIFRNGTTTGDKAFTICRDTALALTEGKQYTVSFYVKPTKVGQAAGTISLLSMDKYATGVNTPSKKEVITTVGELKVGEWQKVSYTFTASDKYVGISTSTGNDMYLDNFTVTLKNYTGTTTGDNTVSPILIIMMIVLAAGALTVTGKKVFEK